MISESWCRAAYVAPSVAPLGWLHWGKAAKATAHVVASMRVSPRDLAGHVPWDIPCAGDGKLSNRVHCFLAPSTARLDGEDDQSASLRCGQLWVGRFMRLWFA